MKWNWTRQSWLVAILADLGAAPIALWIRRQERTIRALGTPLSEAELETARRAGVSRPERIRILRVARVPFPFDRVVRRLALWSGRFPDAAIGMAARYGIYLQADARDSAAILAHEFVHTGQFERLGGIIAFLRAYFRDCLVNGYADAALEKEAHTVGATALDRAA